MSHLPGVDLLDAAFDIEFFNPSKSFIKLNYWALFLSLLVSPTIRTWYRTRTFSCAAPIINSITSSLFLLPFELLRWMNHFQCSPTDYTENFPTVWRIQRQSVWKRRNKANRRSICVCKYQWWGEGTRRDNESISCFSPVSRPPF